MPGMDGWTRDGARMLPCLACNGTVFCKLLYVGITGDIRGSVSAMCDTCRRHAVVMLPAGAQISAQDAETYYQQARTELAASQP